MPIDEQCDHRRRFFASDEDYVPCPDCEAQMASARPLLVTKSVLEEIGTERKRQRSVEGWTPEHDDRHTNSALALAAACYAAHRRFPDYADRMWPYDEEWWKPTNERRDLIKAAALIVAEIERLDRAPMAMRAGQ